MRQPWRPPWRPQSVIAVVLAIVAAIVVLAATQQGVGVSPDSIAYLSTADSIAAGRGAMTLTPEGWRPLTHFPPLYPLVLSIGSARAVHVLLFPLFIAAACLLAYDGSGRSLAATILAGAALLASREVVHAFAMAWSEPLFFVLLFAFFAVLRRAGVPPAQFLVAAALLAAAATLTRYAGISIIATGAAALLLWSDGPALRRFRNAAIFTAVAILPVAAWLLRNALTGGSATARPLLFHPMPFSAYLIGAENVWHFLMRGWEGMGVLERIPRNLHALAGASFAAFFIAAGLREKNRLTRLLGLFALLYVVVFVAVGAFLDAVVFDDRLLLPFTMTVAMLAVILLVRWTERRRTARVVLLVLFALHIAAGARVVLSFVSEARREGLDFNSRAWKRSPLIRRVAQLPATTSICSNADDAIRFLTGRPASTLPSRSSPVTTLVNPLYRAELRGTARCGVIVWFSTVPWRAYLPSREELLALPQLREIAREDDGSILARSDAGIDHRPELQPGKVHPRND